LDDLIDSSSFMVGGTQLMSQSKLSTEAVLLQGDFLRNAMSFYSTVAIYLNSVIVPGRAFVDGYPELPLPPQVPPLFANLPEWYVEDIAEFLLFCLQ